ncbi:MAG: tetratricopeptide repeat protein [Planctomycetes bacterium]|nr:tetratricopeptide repeat protein [Planctomycetota bacterium]
MTKGTPSNPVTPSHRRLSALLIGMIVIAAIIAFAPGLRSEFLNWDDDRNFLDNPDYRGIGAAQWQWAWSTYHLGVWQPLAWMLLGAQYAVAGMNPVGYHTTSIALHALNGVLVYFLTRRILQGIGGRIGSDDPATQLASAAGAILFVVHPLRVEAVAWVSCQPYLPSVAAYLTAILVYLRSGDFAQGSNRSHRRWATVLGLYIVALCFKAVAVSLPAVLLVLDVWLLGRWRRGNRVRLVAEKVPFFLVAVVASLWALSAKDYNESRVPFHELDFVVRFAQSAWGIWFYLVKTVWPTGLLPYYRLPDDLRLTTPIYALCAVGVTLITIGLILARRRSPALLAAWLCYLIILLPNLGVIQIGLQLAADRYSYLAIIAPTVALAWLLRFALRDGKRVVSACVAVILIASLFTRATWKHLTLWSTSERLWSATIEADPKCAVAHCNLGEALMRKSQFTEASKHLSTAIDVDPRLSFAYANLGTLFCQVRKFDEAIHCGEYVLQAQPGLKGKDLARTHAMLGQAYAGIRRDDMAWKHTREAQRLGLAEASKMIEYLSTVSKEPATKASP